MSGVQQMVCRGPNCREHQKCEEKASTGAEKRQPLQDSSVARVFPRPASQAGPELRVSPRDPLARGLPILLPRSPGPDQAEFLHPIKNLMACQAEELACRFLLPSETFERLKDQLLLEVVEVDPVRGNGIGAPSVAQRSRASDPGQDVFTRH